MNAIAECCISYEEYLRLEEASGQKHEYLNGRIYAMAGGTPSHSAVATNIVGALFSRLRGKPCRPFNSDLRVKVEATGLRTYPDVTVACPPERYDERDSNSLLNPTVIFEVLSPSTERYDRTDKFDALKQTPELRDYVLVSPDRVRVEHLRRGEGGEWILESYTQRSQVLVLASIGVEVPLDEIYDRLELPEGLRVMHGDVLDAAGVA